MSLPETPEWAAATRSVADLEFPTVEDRARLLADLGAQETRVTDDVFNGGFQISEAVSGQWFAEDVEQEGYVPTGKPLVIQAVTLNGVTEPGLGLQARDELGARLQEEWGEPRVVEDRLEWTRNGRIVSLGAGKPANTGLDVVVVVPEAYDEYFW